MRRWRQNEKFLCNPPEAPIWMEDFTFKPIGEIKPGDRILGWEKHVPQTKRNKTGRHRDAIVVATVEHVMRRIAPIVKVTMESGTVIRCTADHWWSNGNKGGRAGCPWVNAKVGRTLRKLVDVYPNNPPDERLAGWLGGIYDGEGSRRTISQSPTANPVVFAEIPRVMRALGFETKTWESTTRTSTGWLLYGGWAAAAKFLAWCKPVKSKSLLKEIFSSHVRADSEKVVKVEDDGEGEVVSMQTSTGNYICWGYMSKNCFADASYFVTRYARIRDVKERIVRVEYRKAQKLFHQLLAKYDDRQVAIQLFILKARQVGISTVVAMYFLHRVLFRTNVHAIMASAQIPQSDKLAKMVWTTWEKLPFWLPPPQTVLKEREPVWANGGAMSIQAGSQDVGIAQGSTPTCIHLCLHPQTLIHLEHGQAKPICEVLPGEKVITSRGALRKVKAVERSTRGPETACELAIWGNYSPLIVTRDHPILTPDGFVAAENLEKGDFVCMPVRPIRHTVREIELEHRPTGWHGHNGTRTVKTQKVKLTRAWGWMCGFYLSEGSLHRNNRLEGNPVDGVYFSIHPNELERSKLGLTEALGIFQKMRPYTSKQSLSTSIAVNGAGLARWLELEFGSGASGKKIPDWVFDAGTDFCEGLVRGYLEGDGHISPRVSEVICHSISMPLLLNLRDLIASLGIGWSSLYFKESGIYYGRNCKQQWSLSVNADASRRLRSRMGWPQVVPHGSATRRALKWQYSPDRKFVWLKIFENRPVFCESFYDLEVNAQEHDFCTIHCCVKNSEIADYKTPKKTIEEGLFPAAHQTDALFFVLEGTGSTSSAWQKEKWDYYKSHWGQGGRFQTLFIPPCCADDIYPHADWLRANPMPEGWPRQASNETRRMRRRAELFVRSTDYLAEELGRSWEMSREYMWYWQCGYNEAVASHSEKTYLAQNASHRRRRFSIEVRSGISGRDYRDYD